MNENRNWEAVLIYPNFQTSVSIETKSAAIIGQTDKRWENLVTSDPQFNRFISSFSDNFGRKVTPSILIRQNDFDAFALNVDAYASLRDIMAMSVVPYNLSQKIDTQNDNSLICWSDYFEIYPWMLDQTGQFVIGHNLALQVQLNDLREFTGQSSPELSQVALTEAHIDSPLLNLLLQQWERLYASEMRDPENIKYLTKLFRSLNMAFQASKLPGSKDVTLYDCGRSLALWVSAFEILAHPNEGNVNLDTIYELLEKEGLWRKTELLDKRSAYKSRAHREDRIIPCWLYGELYHARNDFLHGNPITSERLRLFSGHDLPQFVAPLYRMALTSFLDLGYCALYRGEENSKNYIDIKTKFECYQFIIEDSILKSTKEATSNTPLPRA